MPKPLTVCLSAALLAAAVLPARAEPVPYTIDPGHTYPSFKVPHKGISFWRGKFNHSRGTVLLDRVAGSGSVDIVIDAASIDFGHDKMNEHARNADYFNVEQYPEARYRGPLVFAAGQPVAVDGELTLLGVTRPLRLTVTSFGCIQHPVLKREVCGADGYADFNRADFGMTKSADGPLGQVHIDIQVEAVRD